MCDLCDAILILYLAKQVLGSPTIDNFDILLIRFVSIEPTAKVKKNLLHLIQIKGTL